MITFICGQLCSGKTKFALAYKELCQGNFIEVGDIVRTIKQTTDRKQLQDTKHLIYQIVEEIRSAISDDVTTNWIISGVRQKEIIESFPDSVCLWIQAPVEVRKLRYEARSRSGDERTFEEADRGDVDLGILEVKKYIFNNIV
jgi:cytidylate kinase